MEGGELARCAASGKTLLFLPFIQSNYAVMFCYVVLSFVICHSFLSHTNTFEYLLCGRQYSKYLHH